MFAGHGRAPEPEQIAFFLTHLPRVPIAAVEEGVRRAVLDETRRSMDFAPGIARVAMHVRQAAGDLAREEAAGRTLPPPPNHDEVERWKRVHAVYSRLLDEGFAARSVPERFQAWAEAERRVAESDVF